MCIRDRIRVDRSFLDGVENACHQFMPVKGLIRTVFFLYHQHGTVYGFIGRKAFAAAQTLPPPANPFIVRTRIQHTGFRVDVYKRQALNQA